MENDNPGKRRQRLKELRAQGGGEGRRGQRGAGSGERRPMGQRRQRAGAGRGAGEGEGRLLERFPKLREAMAQRNNEGEAAGNQRGEGQGKPLLREFIKRRRAGGAQGGAKGGAGQRRDLSQMDEQQLQQRADKLQAKLDETLRELEALKERKARDQETAGEG